MPNVPGTKCEMKHIHLKIACRIKCEGGGNKNKTCFYVSTEFVSFEDEESARDTGYTDYVVG